MESISADTSRATMILFRPRPTYRVSTISRVGSALKQNNPTRMILVSVAVAVISEIRASFSLTSGVNPTRRSRGREELDILTFVASGHQ